MNKAGQLLLEYPKQDSFISFLLALSIHGSLLAAGGELLTKPVEFAVDAGIGGIEVDLVAAPQEPEQKITTETIEPISVRELVKEEKPPFMKKQAEDKKSSNLGKDTITLSSMGGALTQRQPKYWKNPAPSYPMEARKLGQEGLVVLVVDVDPRGNPSQVKVKQSAGYSSLDEAALKAVYRWKFSPAQIGKLPIESKAEVPIRFRLEKSEK